MTEQKLTAAALVADKRLTTAEIAAKAGVTERTVYLWKKDKKFQAEVARAQNAWRDKALTVGLAEVAFRMRNLNDRHRRLRAVITHRARKPEMLEVAEGRTGLIVATYKMQSMGEGRGSTAVPEYAVDVPMLQEMREIEDQAAVEMGQRKQKVERAGGIDINVLIANINEGRARVVREKAERLKAEAAGLPI